MTNIKEQYKKDIVHMCKKIIERNHDYDLDIMGDLEIERIGLDFDDFIITIKEEKFNLNAFTSIEDCKYILGNVNKIDYIYSSNDNFDTILGNISDFIVNAFNCKRFDITYMTAIRYCRIFRENTKTPFTKEDVINYMRENM